MLAFAPQSSGQAYLSPVEPVPDLVTERSWQAGTASLPAPSGWVKLGGLNCVLLTDGWEAG